MKNVTCLYTLILFLLFVNLAQAKGLRDIINPVTVYAGVKDSLVIDDLFYLDKYDVNFLPNKDLNVNFDIKKHLLFITPNKNFNGTTFLDFEYDGQKYSILVISKLKYDYTFSFKPNYKPKKITIFGNFNNWNRQELDLREQQDGWYSLTYSFDPGRYEYKYFVDGMEFLDQKNHDSIPNGIGGYNTNLNIIDKAASSSYLYILDKNDSGDFLELNFKFKGDSKETNVAFNNIYSLLDNKKVKTFIEVENNNISVKLNKKEIKGEHTFRILVNIEGKLTNLQTVMLYDGNVKDLKSAFNWYDGIIYSLMTDRFSNGDKNNDNPIKQDSLFDQANYNGGDFKGILNKLNTGYFDSLGINTIWLSPVYDNPNNAYREYPAPNRWFSGYHGYWPISDNMVEEHFGTMDDLKEIVKTAHSKGIKILLDFVSHHVHIQHPYFKNHPEWFGKLELPDGRLNLRFWDEYRLTTWFEPYLPSFDFLSSPVGMEAVADNAIWWLKETGADGFRHDAVKHVPNEFWRTLTKKLKAEIEYPNNCKVYQIGETFGSYGLISSYVNNGQLSAQFNFNLFDRSIPVFIDTTVSFSALANELKQTERVYGNPHYMGNIIDSHDKVRFMAYADGDIKPGGEGLGTEIGWNNPPKVDDPKSYDYAALYMAFLNTIPGLPVVYYGTESGMTGASDPDNRRMMKFEDQLDVYQKSLLNKTRKIINIRKNTTALKYGDLLPVLVKKDQFAYIRSDFNERILVVLNKDLNVSNVEINIPAEYLEKEGVDLIDGAVYKINNNMLMLNLTGKGYKIIKFKK
ncbi:MAG: alpha-amylase family glycosyl hydrolase [bacterium]